MKKITLTPVEFFTFRTLANQLKIMFEHVVSGGYVTVEAEAASLERLGY